MVSDERLTVEEIAAAPLAERKLRIALLIATAEQARANERRLIVGLNDLVAAWESLPGPKRYTYMEVEKWLVGIMAPAFDKARAALAGEGGET